MLKLDPRKNLLWSRIVQRDADAHQVKDWRLLLLLEQGATWRTDTRVDELAADTIVERKWSPASEAQRIAEDSERARPGSLVREFGDS